MVLLPAQRELLVSKLQNRIPQNLEATLMKEAMSLKPRKLDSQNEAEQTL